MRGRNASVGVNKPLELSRETKAWLSISIFYGDEPEQNSKRWNLSALISKINTFRVGKVNAIYLVNLYLMQGIVNANFLVMEIVELNAKQCKK